MKKHKYTNEEIEIIKNHGNPAIDNLIIAKNSYDPFTGEKETLLTLAKNRMKSREVYSEIQRDNHEKV